MERDPNTLSNYRSWLTKHTTANFSIDFDARRLKGSVTLQLQSQTDSVSKEIVLDTSYLSISGVTLNNQPAKWHVADRVEPFGSPLHVAVPEGVVKGTDIELTVDVATTDCCTALQWLTPQQTSNGRAPYMFSQCQAIHARSIFPCQDTPDVKSTFSFNISSPLPVVASGLSVDADDGGAPGQREHAGESWTGEWKQEGERPVKLYRFEQKVPIPSYLFALASGDIATARIGPRSLVANSPELLEASRWELEHDVEKFMEVADGLVFPYQWGMYNVLVLPPSFPYGGMENPIFTFATPSIISGDRQNVDVIAHELSHSWSGNLVTNCSWEHFWLNEGWTTYLERRIAAAVHGEPQRDFSAIIGWKALCDAVDHLRDTNEFQFTQLVIDLKGRDPDDAFSTVPYEKGFHFLYYLEKLVGKDHFDEFIKHYFTKWARKSLNSFEFRDTFLDFFRGYGNDDIVSKLGTIDWEGWFYKPGLPPKPEFDTTYVDMCYKLADSWQSKDFTPSPSDMEGWSGNQKLVFLEKLETFDPPLSKEASQKLASTYGILSSQNAELLCAYFLVALKAEDSAVYERVYEFLGTIGRMKYIRPLFRALNKVAPDLAAKAFEQYKNFYHPIARAQVEKDLRIAK